MSEQIPKLMKKHSSGVKGVTFEKGKNRWQAVYYDNYVKKIKYFPVGTAKFPNPEIDNKLYESAKQRAIEFHHSIENKNQVVEPVQIPEIEPVINQKDNKKMYCESCMFSFSKTHMTKHMASNKHKNQGLGIVRNEIERQTNTYVCYFRVDGVKTSKYFNSWIVGDEIAKQRALDFRKQMAEANGDLL